MLLIYICGHNYEQPKTDMLGGVFRVDQFDVCLEAARKLWDDAVESGYADPSYGSWYINEVPVGVSLKFQGNEPNPIKTIVTFDAETGEEEFVHPLATDV